VGVSGIYKFDDLLLQGDVFTDNLDDLRAGNNSVGVDLWLVAVPKLGDAQLHFGGSYHWRDLANSIRVLG
jgi:phosphate-selective porin OprO/OprP